jgi:hypothetical protein
MAFYRRIRGVRTGAKTKVKDTGTIEFKHKVYAIML